MTIETDTSKGLNKVEMKLLNDFVNTVNAREFSANVTIQKLTLAYTEEDGFVIDLVETPNPELQPSV